MSIDIGDFPVGTPPTLSQIQQIKTSLELGNVQNVDISTWTGSPNISSVGPITITSAQVSDFNSSVNALIPPSNVAQLSANWESTYTTVTNNSASWINVPESDTLSTVTSRGNVTTNSISVSGLSASKISLNLTAGLSAGVGQLVWNDTDGTVDIGLKGGNVTLQVGQEQLLRVVNKTGVDLLESEFKVVRIRTVAEGGAQGQRLAVVLAQADTTSNHSTTLGVVTENITNNLEGFITTSGNVRKINTTGSLYGETWVDGDVLYLSPTIPGGLTNIQPDAPNHSVIVGYVEYAHANEGKLFVKVNEGYELEDIHNVSITSPQNNDVLTYDNLSGIWKNAPSTGNDTTLRNLSSNWQSTYTTVATNSSAWSSSDDVAVSTKVRASSANWDSNYTTVRSNSSKWENVFNTVTNLSTNWNYQGLDLKSLSANWQSTYTTVAANSATWGGGSDDVLASTKVRSSSANWDSTYFTVANLSSGWGGGSDDVLASTKVRSSSANWDSTYTTVRNNSATWITSNTTGISGADIVSNIVSLTQAEYDAIGVPSPTTYYIITDAPEAGDAAVSTKVRASSANWDSTYTTVAANSATWGGSSDDVAVSTKVRASSANWDSTYNTVTLLSSNWNYQGLDLKSLSANWQSTYTTVAANSSIWITSNTTGISGADIVSNIVSLTQAEYDALTPDPATVYIITDEVTEDTAVSTKVRASSANWDNTYTTVQANSSSWGGESDDVAVSTLVRSSSATWVTSEDIDVIEVLTQAEYDALTPPLSTTFYIISDATPSGGSDDVAVSTKVRASSANWDNTYTTVASKSATWTSFSSSSALAEILSDEIGYVSASASKVLFGDQNVSTTSSPLFEYIRVNMVTPPYYLWYKDSIRNVTSDSSDYITHGTHGPTISFRETGPSSGGIGVGPTGKLVWESTKSRIISNPDTAISRSLSGVLEINNGTKGQYRDLKLQNLIATGTLSSTQTTNWDSTYTTVQANSSSWGGESTTPHYIGVKVDGSGSVPLTGVKGYEVAKFAGTLNAYTIVANGESPTCTWGVWKTSGGTALPTLSSDIVGIGTAPTLSANNVVTNSITDWSTVVVSVGDVFGFELKSITTATQASLTLEIIP